QWQRYRLASRRADSVPAERRAGRLLPRRCAPGGVPSWRQTDPGGVELTASSYRIPLSPTAGGDTSLAVVEDQPLEETIRLMDGKDDQIGALAASTELDAKLRQTLTELGGRRQAIARQRTEFERLKEQRAQLVEDESRLRDDLNALGRDVPLRKRLLDKFAETTTAIDTVTATIGKSDSALAAAEKELVSYVAAMKL